MIPPCLHRYKEERKLGKSASESGTITLTRVGRAIMLTSITQWLLLCKSFLGYRSLAKFWYRSSMALRCILVDWFVGPIAANEF